MSWAITITSQPEVEPVSDAEARAQCRLEADDSVPELAIYIRAARSLLETRMNRGALITQEVTLTSANEADLANLGVFPVQTIDSITYLVDGEETEAAEGYFVPQLAGQYPSLPLGSGYSWPGRIIVTATVGYGDDADAVPADLKLVMLLAISAMYDNRGALPEDFWDSVEHLMQPYRRLAIA